jgi:hypothetical protein
MKGVLAMDSEPKISLPVIVVCLRIVGCLCPPAAVVLAGVANMETGPGWAVVIASLAVTLLWFALASVIQLLDRIDKRLARSGTIPTPEATN